MILNRIAIIVAAIVALPILLWLGGYLLPAEVTLQTERQVDASAERVFEVINNVEGLSGWWQQANIDMDESFALTHLEGPAKGQGMVIGFTSPAGDLLESWHFVEVEPDRFFIEVDFQIFTSFRTLTLLPNEQGTLVHWQEVATVNEPHWRWLLYLNREAALNNRQVVLGSLGKVAASVDG